MKKNIVIGVLLCLVATLLIFAYIKASDAEMAAANVIALERQASETHQKASAQERLATEMAARFTREKHRADMLAEELSKCKRN